MAIKKTPTTKTNKAVSAKAAKPAATSPKPGKTAPQTAAAKPMTAAPSPEKKTAPTKKAATKTKTTTSKPNKSITAEERWQMISEAAYFLAEKRGFSGGNPCDDWTQAESQVDALLRQRSAGG
jgi:glucan-binding YG repeat protein